MAAYVPGIIWLLGALVCHYIARKRHVKPTVVRTLIVVLLGPLAIPLALTAKPDGSSDSP